jgi:tetratricopeptide (TPR) repeat protein
MKAAGWDTIPLFMKDLPKELNQADPNAPVNHTIEALQALIYDEDEDEKLRSLEALKARANELFGCRDYRQALGFYKQAIDILEKPASTDTTHSEPESTADTNIPQELRSSIYSNRAACHLSLGRSHVQGHLNYSSSS